MGDAQKEKAPLVRRGFKTKGVGGWGWGIAFRSPQQCAAGILCSWSFRQKFFVSAAKSSELRAAPDIHSRD
jgi:hypothetical protein